MHWLATRTMCKKGGGRMTGPPWRSSSCCCSFDLRTTCCCCVPQGAELKFPSCRCSWLACFLSERGCQRTTVCSTSAKQDCHGGDLVGVFSVVRWFVWWWWCLVVVVLGWREGRWVDDVRTHRDCRKKTMSLVEPTISYFPKCCRSLL